MAFSIKKIESTVFSIFLVLGCTIIHGCVSVHYLKGNKTPAVMGFGSAKPMETTDGQVFRVLTPGLSLHLTPEDLGLSFGWRETLYFYPKPDEEKKTESPKTPKDQGTSNKKKTKPSAYQIKSYGIDCGNGALSVGYSRTLFIPSAQIGESMVQFLHYDEKNPEKTIVIRKEKL
jgi:hypothetical protein